MRSVHSGTAGAVIRNGDGSLTLALHGVADAAVLVLGIRVQEDGVVTERRGGEDRDVAGEAGAGAKRTAAERLHVQPHFAVRGGGAGNTAQAEMLVDDDVEGGGAVDDRSDGERVLVETEIDQREVERQRIGNRK